MTPMDELEPLYGVRYVADTFHVTSETVRAWIKAGKLPAQQINGYWRVRRSDLMNFANHKFGPQPAVS